MNENVPRLEEYPGTRHLQRTPVERRNLVSTYLPALMLVTDWSLLRGRTQGDVMRASVEGGVNMLQMRDPLPVAGMPSDRPPSVDLTGVSPEAMDMAREAVALSTDFITLGAASLGAMTIANGAMVLVHSGGRAAAAAIVEQLDALEQRAVGLHVPDGPLTGLGIAPGTRPTRDILPQGLVVSRSVHSIEAAVQAERDGADMLVLGTVFPSSSHPDGPTIGLDGVRAVCDAVSIPVIGIGGITAANAGDVIRAGASGVAVISAIFDAEDPRAAAAELRAAIDAAWAERR